MLSLHSSFTLLRTPKLLCLLGLIYFLLLSGLPVEAQTPSKEISAANGLANQKAFAKSLSKNPWSNIKGFRSAKFGMDEKGVYRAIAKDFKLAKSKVKQVLNRNELTTALEVTIPELFSTGGTAKIGYIFGYKSKKLSQINIVWGQAGGGNVDTSSIVDTANLLRTHFLKKRYKEDGLVANGSLSDTSTMVFRGKDRKDKMILLVLNVPLAKSKLTAEGSNNQVTLMLSYIEDAAKPDIRKIVIGDDEF
jgi:hypothetical protein